MHDVMRKATGVATSLIVTLSLVHPTLAQEVTLSLTEEEAAEEQVVAAPTDAPLVRFAKLDRSWVVYRESDSQQIWAIGADGTTKHEIQTLAFFSAFDANYLVKLLKPGRLDGLTVGAPITSADGLDEDAYRKRPFQCRLVKVADRPAVYVVCFGKRRAVVHEDVFHRFGWEFRDVETVPQAELDGYTDEGVVTDDTVFEEGVEIEGTEDRQLRERLTTRLDLRGKRVVRQRVVRVIGRPDLYVITRDGLRRRIRDVAALRRLAIDVGEVSEVTADELAAFPEGEPLTAESDDDFLEEEVE